MRLLLFLLLFIPLPAASMGKDDCDGTTYEMWVTPITMAERERAQKGPKGDDANEFALRLLIAKACDENGERLFQMGEIDVLKNEVRDADLQALMLAVLQDDEDAIDPKS